MKKLLASALLLLGLSAGLYYTNIPQAVAQNVTCALRPPTTNDNSCASTSFVQRAITTICTLTPSTCTTMLGYANIEWWGAVGDGNIANAAINASATNSALDTGLCAFAPNRTAAGGFNYGTNTVTVEQGQCFKGDESLLIYTGNSSFILYNSYDERTTISGFYIEMDGGGSSSKAVVADTATGSVYRARLANITVTNAYGCLSQTTGGAGGYVTDLQITDVICQRPKGIQIYFTLTRGFISMNDVYVDGAQLASATRNINYPLIRFEDYQGIQGHKVHCSGQSGINGAARTYEANAVCMYFGSAGVASSYLWLTDSIIEASQGPGIFVVDTSFVNFSNVRSQASMGYGIYVENGGYLAWQDVWARGSNDLAGTIPTVRHGIVLTGVTRGVTVNVQSENATGSGVYINNSTRLLGGEWRTDNNTRYGIEEAGTSDNNSLINWTYTGNTISPLLQVGASSVFRQGIDLMATSRPYVIGDLFYADATGTIAKLPGVATGNALISGGVATAFSWGKVGLTTHVSGTLAVGNGGTGLTAGTSGGVPYFNSTSTMASSGLLTANGVMLGGGAGAAPTTTSAGTTGQVLTGNTGSAPTFQSQTQHINISAYPGGTGGNTLYAVNNGTATEGSVSVPLAKAGSFTGLYAVLSTGPVGAETVTVTLRVNGSDTAVTCQIKGAATSCSDLAHTAAITAGQLFSVKYVWSAGAAASFPRGSLLFSSP